MNRIVTTITVMTAPVFLASAVQADDVLLQQINSRLMSIESRLNALEKVTQPGSSSYAQLSDAATLEATNGTTPKIPAPPIPEATAPAPVSEEKKAPAQRASTTYVIKDGDTLGSIARAHEIERGELLKANRLSEGQPIYIGETLLIPGTEPLGAETSSTSQIAKVDAPDAAPVMEQSIVVGETQNTSSGKTHTVVLGDTLTSIAKERGITVAAIKQANGLEDDVIGLGQKLVMPAAGTATASEKTTEVALNEAGDSENVSYEYDNPLLNEEETYGYYTVRKGDNLYALARDFFTSMAELQRLNRLGSSTLIYPGNELIVPTTKYNEYHNSSDVAQR